jgi:hypothetical protein
MNRKKPNLKIWTKPTSHFVFTTDICDDVITEVNRFYKWIRLENASETPISICEFTIREKGAKGYKFVSHSMLDPVKYEDNIGGNVITPLMGIDPYGTVEGYILFLGLFDVPKENTKYILTVRTPRKSFKKEFKVDYTERDI